MLFQKKVLPLHPLRSIYINQRLDHRRVHPFPVVQIPLIHAAEQYLGGGNVGGNGYAVHITQAEQILLVGAAAVGPERIAEEQHQIHFIAGNTGGDLLNAAQLSGEVTVNWQAGGLVQHPAGGTGGNDSVPGQDTTVGGAELKCKFFAGIMCKNGNCHNSLSPLY